MLCGVQTRLLFTVYACYQMQRKKIIVMLWSILPDVRGTMEKDGS